MFFRKLEETMVDSDVSKLFKRATGRDYTSRETCVNDIRRLCAKFWNEELERRLKHHTTADTQLRSIDQLIQNKSYKR